MTLTNLLRTIAQALLFGFGLAFLRGTISFLVSRAGQSPGLAFALLLVGSLLALGATAWLLHRFWTLCGWTVLRLSTLKTKKDVSTATSGVDEVTQ